MEQLLQNVRSNFVYKDGRLYDKEGKDKSTKHSRGYRQLYLNGTCFLLHRLIFFYFHGVFPKIVDHIDGDINNNSIENLQGCDQKVNIGKAKIFSTNTTGFKGVSYHKQTGKYAGYFWENYKKIHCGLYDTAEEAYKARQKRKYNEQ
jgi:hypothetical protein